MAVQFHGPSGLEFLQTQLGIPFFDRVVSISFEGEIYADDTLSELSNFKQLVRMTHLNTKFTDAGLQRFKTQRPDCQVN